jgi:RNA-binding protein 15
MGGPMERMPYENKKDKFPNYLHHISPEDDPLATRTLFTGNLEINITDEEMRRIFGRYGTVEDIDIKRPPPGTGNAYAFVRYVNLDMAARAKTELSGQYIGKFQCKIGYGKVNPTTKIWVGGLGPWASLVQLEREFDRFGSIKKIDWSKGDSQAFITYETIDAAQAAVKDMRGYPLGGPDKRLRTDFAGVEQVVGYAKKYDDYDSSFDRSFSNNSSRAPDTRASRTPIKGTSGHSSDIGSSPSDSESGKQRARNGNHLSGVTTIADIPKKVDAGWQGSMILKTSSFPAKLYITEGDLESVEALMKDEEGKNLLRITQRLRLDQGKLEDVTKRMGNCTSFGVFLALPTSAAPSSPVSSDGHSPSVQSRPLRNLVSYLKQKEAAGVIALQNRETNAILYAFPPCKFSYDLLLKNIPGLEEPTEDHLVVLVIHGGA